MKREKKEGAKADSWLRRTETTTWTYHEVDDVACWTISGTIEKGLIHIDQTMPLTTNEAHDWWLPTNNLVGWHT